ncbi:hypothetical protein AB0M46_09250 [Dactylosporangium sp. NPDC051485]|uniref:hypothetical protein n=1 Tax=Dactylosporangium sp. NPDC051485 TaxID=3154846 RepID=UPI003432563C
MPREERVVGLDELFDTGRSAPRPDARPTRRPSRPFDTRWWIRRVFIAVALTSVGCGVLYVVGYSVSYPLVLLSIVAIQVMREALVQVHADLLPPAVTGAGLRPVHPPKEGAAARDDRPTRRELRDAIPAGDGILLAVAKWNDRLVWGERDPGRFAALVVPRFTDLVDARLRERHGITLAAAPEQARELVGEELWQLLHYTPSRVPSPQDLASIVAKVEAL